MGKKGPVSKSLQGKKPINSAQKIVAKHKNSRQNDDIHVPKNPGQIGNKLKRSEMYGKYLHQKALVKQEKRRQQQQQQQQQSKDDDNVVPKNVPKTLDSMREMDITMVRPDDMNEILGDEADDEFSPYFMTPVTTTRCDVKEEDDDEDGADDNDDNDEEEDDDEVDCEENATTGLDEEGDDDEEEDDDEEDEEDNSVNEPLPEGPVPKILITTRPHPSQKIFYFIGDLQNLLPQLYYYPRQQYTLSQITQYAYNRHFTHLIVVSEKNKVCNGMIISHLGYRPPNDVTNDPPPLVGPTAYFKVSNVVTGSKIPHHGCRTSHRSEMNLHNFHHTRLGHRIGRLFASLFPIQHGPQFEGRQIVTFHNQRDYIFVRHHRYIFQSTDQSSSSRKEPAAKSSTKKNTKEIALDTTTQPTQVSESAAHIPVRTKLQELGPRFTLKLRWLQDGIIDENQSANSVYEFLHKRKEMDTSRRKFHL